MNRHFSAAFTFIVASFFLCAAPARSDTMNEPICAAVYACDDAGEVLPDYRGGACEQYYRRQCNISKNDQLTECTTAYSKSRAESQRLEKTVAQLKRSLRQARRGRR